MQILKAGVLYFAFVFGVGFILGPIRVLGVAPRLGTRMAELLETPVMLVVIILAARWIVRRLAVTPTLSCRLCLGCIVLIFLLVSAFTHHVCVLGLYVQLSH